MTADTLTAAIAILTVLGSLIAAWATRKSTTVEGFDKLVTQLQVQVERLANRVTALEAELAGEERHALEQQQKISEQSALIDTQQLRIVDLERKVHDQRNEITRLKAALTRAGFNPDRPDVGDDIEGEPV